MTTTLEYFGRQMNPTTVDGNSPADVAALLGDHSYARATLEPGDGTRYELHVIHSSPTCLLVVRDSGGEPTAAFIPTSFSDFDLGPLTNGNEWTQQFLRWWLALVIAEMVDAG